MKGVRCMFFFLLKPAPAKMPGIIQRNMSMRKTAVPGMNTSIKAIRMKEGRNTTNHVIMKSWTLRGSG